MAIHIERAPGEFILHVIQSKQKSEERWYVLHVELSKLSDATFNDKKHLPIIFGMLDAAFASISPRCFLCDNKDVIIIFDQLSLKTLEATTLNLQAFFQTDPLFQGADLGGLTYENSPLISFYDSKVNLDSFLPLLANMIEQGKKASAEKVTAKLTDFPINQEILTKSIEQRLGREKLRLMCVVDQRMVQTLFSGAFAKDYDVVVVSDAPAAIDKYAFFAPDLIFIDINMPIFDGYQLLERVVGMDPKAFPVMLTGDSAMNQVQKAIAIGAKGYVVKPFTKVQIEKYIDIYKAQHPK